MILAAGLGTRLRPLTFVRPKALVPVMGLPILDYWIRRLHDAGFEAVVVNAYHLPDQLRASVLGGNWPIPVDVVVESTLLGTGGGIRNTLDFFQDEPFAVINGDIVCEVDLGDLRERHEATGRALNLLLHDCLQFNNVAVSQSGEILGLGSEAAALASDRADMRLLAFTGIQIMHPSILGRLPKGAPHDILSVYRHLIQIERPPGALVAQDLYWREMGSLEAYRNLNRELSTRRRPLLAPLASGKPICIDSEAFVGSGARLKGFVVVGKDSHVSDGALLEDTILWDRVRIGKGAELRRCIVADGLAVEGHHENEVLVGESS